MASFPSVSGMSTNFEIAKCAIPPLLPLSNNYSFERSVTFIISIMSFLNLELALFSHMANATTHLTDKVLKMIGGLYGKGKREDCVGRMGGSKRNLKIQSVITEIAISFSEKFLVREEVSASNCWYSGEFSGGRSG